MTRLPVMAAKDLEKILLHVGFIKIRQHGSHAFYRHPDGRTTTIPHHKGHDISRPMVRTILREIKIDIETFNSLLDN